MSKEFTPEQKVRYEALDVENTDAHEQLLFLLIKAKKLLKERGSLPHELKKQLALLGEKRDRISKKIIDFLDSIS